MSKEIYISSTPHETRLAIVETDELTEIYYERENEYTLAGSIYNGRVTRVLPGMQSSFVDIGLERDAFLYITDFMEEAADTAEFDHTGDAGRPARVERSDRGERPERNGSDGRESGRYVSERNQEQANATPASDMAGASEGRGEEFGGRSDRGERGRGRGRRDRGERSPGRSERSQSAEGTAGLSQAAPASEAVEDAFATETMAAPPTMNRPGVGPDDAVELGEGAPGADGSRRWRGRRGRRRGRGAGAREGVAGVSEENTFSAQVPEAEFEEAPSLEVDGSEAMQVTSVPTEQERVEETATEERGHGRGGRGSRAQAALRVPRGFAPRRSLYGVDGSADTEEAATEQTLDVLAASGAEPEPLILPGESLSKYRKGSGEESATAVPVRGMATPITLPDSGFKVDPNWDGGAMLPGETLSRYRGVSPRGGGSPAQVEPGRSDLGRPDRGRTGQERGGGRREGGTDRERSRDGGREGGASRRPDGGSREVAAGSLMVPAMVPGADLQSPGPVLGYAHASEQADEMLAHRPDFGHSELPEPTAEAPRIEDGGSAHAAGSPHSGVIEQVDGAQEMAVSEVQDEEEYEPEGKAVSYRVDPVPPSEYRMQRGGGAAVEDEAGGVEGVEELASQPEHAVAVSPSGEVFAVAQETPAESFKGVFSALPSGLIATRFAASREVEAPSHELTTIDASGVMHSEHDVEAADQAFAPGAGDLEEDFIEDDETEIGGLQAQSEEEFDDLEEEEHLEGAADLGMMIRDLTVDQITRAGGASSLDEDEDFVEDTLEEGGNEGEDPEEPMPFAASPEQDAEASSQSTAHRGLNRENGYAPANVRDGRGRDNGRRGGRDRTGGRESGNRAPRQDRYEPGASDRGGSGVDRTGSERSGPDRSGLGERARNTGGASDRDRGRGNGRGGGRQSAQMTNLPAISDLLKPGQEVLVQIAKEPIAKKGARITSHIALPGRFLVFMPTVSHTGVSRKIESDGERRRLKEILMSEKGEAAGGFIVRTAAAGASEEELRSDLRFLLNLWSDIKQRSESSKSPALIYHDLNLVERILRDQVTDNFSAIWVDTETEYERVLRFLQRFQPGLIRRVKLYTKETPLFEQFGITEEINKALRSKVWLKSGGSIVINQTEALVAIDINTGKYVGKTARLEDTIVKTNLDAIPEIVRQIRLRDLGGIIIIDFIDMDERKNRNRVMQALEDELKNDRAPSKVLPFNDFGLVAITRKRVKQSLERTLSTTCNVCTGTGMVKSPVTVCNDIYVEMRKMHKSLDRGDVMLRVHPEVVKQLKATGTRWLQEMEEMCGKTILIKSDPSLHPEQFDIH